MRKTIRMVNKRFLIVDDEKSSVFMLSAFLRSQGHLVNGLTHSTQVMAWLEQNPCDAVILDLAMPELDGISLTRLIRRQFPDLPVVILTGWGYDEKRMRNALDAGANGYVSKGVPIEEVYTALQRVLVPKSVHPEHC